MTLARYQIASIVTISNLFANFLTWILNLMLPPVCTFMFKYPEGRTTRQGYQNIGTLNMK